MSMQTSPNSQMGSTDSQIKTDSTQVVNESDPLKECNVDISIIQELTGNLLQMMPSGTMNDPEKMYAVIMDDKFHDYISRLADAIGDVSEEKMRCMFDKKGLKSSCGKVSQFSDSKNLDKALNVLTKYEKTLAKIKRNILKHYRTYVMYCGGDVASFDKLTKITGKVADVIKTEGFDDSDTGFSLSNIFSVKYENGEYNIGKIALFIVIIIAIFGALYATLFKKKTK